MHRGSPGQHQNAPAMPGEPHAKDPREHCAPSRPLPRSPSPSSTGPQPPAEHQSSFSVDHGPSQRNSVQWGAPPAQWKRSRALVGNMLSLSSRNGDNFKFQLLDPVGFPCDGLRSSPSLEEHPPRLAAQAALRAVSLPCLISRWDKPLALGSLGAETVSGFQQPGRVRKI